MSDVLENLRLAIEGLPIDLRKAMRPTLNGVVVKVYDSQNADDTDEYYKVDVQVGGTDTDPGVLIPYVRVNSLWAQDGYGVFALPEVGAKVKVGFTNADTHLPFVDLSYWDGDNEAPRGFQAGSFAIRGKQGQKVEIKAGTNEIVIAAQSVKTISQVKQEEVVGNQNFGFHGHRTITVDGRETLNANRQVVRITRNNEIEIGGNRDTTIAGSDVKQVGGAHSVSSGGGMAFSSASGMSMAAAFSRNDVVGGNYSLNALGAMSLNPTKPGIYMNSPKGVQIGSTLTPIPAFLAGSVTIGSLDPTKTETILLGGPQAGGQAAVYGPSLLIAIAGILKVLTTVPLGIGNLGVPIFPNPAVVAALADVYTAMGTILSKKVFIAQV